MYALSLFFYIFNIHETFSPNWSRGERGFLEKKVKIMIFDLAIAMSLWRVIFYDCRVHVTALSSCFAIVIVIIILGLFSK